MGLRNGSGSAGPSSIIYVDTDKENDFNSEDDIPSEPEDDASYLSIQAEFRHTSMELDIEEFPDSVEQEDGYMSHAFESGDMQDLSSPTRPGESRRQRSPSPSSRKGKGRQQPSDEDDSYFDDIEAVSSPVSTKRRKAPFGKRNGFSLDDYIETPVRRRNQGEAFPNNPKVLVDPTPTPTKSKAAVIELDSPSVQRGPDLRSMLGDVDDTEVDFIHDDHAHMEDRLNSSFTHMPNQDPLEPYLPPAPSPDTPIDYDPADPDNPDEEEERIAAETERGRIMLQSIREKHSYTPLQTRSAPSAPAQKMKGTVTKDGRNTVLPRLKAAAQVGSPKKGKECVPGSGARRGQNFTRNEVNVTPMGRHTILGPAPRSLPNLKKKTVQLSPATLLGHQPGVLLAEKPKPRPSSSTTKVPPVVDLTMEDSGDEALANSPSKVAPRLDLERFRYAKSFPNHNDI
ncbi:hypothetical protein BJ165DRAFT_909414 [Panaeolus papilionaceus]|nr:hypothetical protein BJ165DRAFT_909414 [Panaeolus papilionaceus]